MKAKLKNPQEIAVMREGGEKLSQILAQLVESSKVGVTLFDIETRAQDLIKKTGGKPGFAMVPGYRWATCINLNEGVVHGIPGERKLRDGDVVSIDIGMFYKGFHTDMSTSFQVGETSLKEESETSKFLKVGKNTLEKAISEVKPGKRIGHISQAIQKNIEKAGYSCVYSLVGHGIGRDLHEYPPIPGVLVGSLEQTPMLKIGMALAIEVIYAMGKPETYTDPEDGWTIVTQDGKIAAVFEKTIAVVSDGYLLITP
ncbi:MAG: type I methionyl aminopeptidase [Patescibacteria group bacterium]|jgi:methionyl aminopeptidase